MAMIRKLLENATCSFCQKEKPVCLSVAFVKDEEECILCWPCAKRQITWHMRQKNVKKTPSPHSTPRDGPAQEVKK